MIKAWLYSFDVSCDDCSAGVGRTGTFLAVDYLLKQAAEDGSISVAACVENLRKQRTAMIQSVVRISDPIKGTEIEEPKSLFHGCPESQK